MAASNTPPQCVFEIVAVEAIRKYLSVDLPPEDVAHFFASTMADQYDIDNLSEDILALLEKALSGKHKKIISSLTRLLSNR